MIRLATRGSTLALAQARAVAERLEAGGARVEIVAMRTEGDRRAEARLAAIGGKGLFVREIEDARDVLVTRAPGGLEVLPRGAIVGTSSPRRRAIALSLRADLVVTPVRGNVDTRLAKLATGDWDAVLLAAAGLRRLAITPRHATPLASEVFVPAVGQGVLGVQARADDVATLAALEPLDHAATRACALAERAFLARLGASCVTPTAAHARHADGRVTMHALVASEDGREVLRERGDGPAADAGAVGRRVAEALLARGAARVVALRPAEVSGGR